VPPNKPKNQTEQLVSLHAISVELFLSFGSYRWPRKQW